MIVPAQHEIPESFALTQLAFDLLAVLSTGAVLTLDQISLHFATPFLLQLLLNVVVVVGTSAPPVVVLIHHPLVGVLSCDTRGEPFEH